jgi:hypothetical protein
MGQGEIELARLPRNKDVIRGKSSDSHFTIHILELVKALFTVAGGRFDLLDVQLFSTTADPSRRFLQEFPSPRHERAPFL